MKPAAKHLAYIDALRGIAFFGVLCCHTCLSVPEMPKALYSLMEKGTMGVQLFFVASAFTIFLSFGSRKDREVHVNRNFFIRRFFRIAPLFYLAALFYSILYAGREDRLPLTVGSVVSTLTFTHGFSPYWINHIVPGGWSIAVEMTFYLAVPFLYAWTGRLKIWQIVTLVIALGVTNEVISLAARKMLAHMMPREDQDHIKFFLVYWLPRQLPIFFIGVILYRVVRDRLGAGTGIDSPVESSNRSILLASALVLASLLSFVFIALWPFPGVRLVFAGVVLFLLPLGLSIYPLRILVNPATCYLGKVSFSAYITHFAVLDFVEWTIGSQSPLGLHLGWLSHVSLLLGFTLLGTVLVSTITYRLIEVPFQRLGSLLIRRLDEKRQAAAVAQDVHAI